MFKKVFSMVCLSVLMFAGCGKDQITNLVPVTVTVSDFSVSQSDFAGAKDPTDVASYSGVKYLTLAFYNGDGTEVYKGTQTKGGMPDGETFGEFSTKLPLGSYSMVALGYMLYDDEALELTSPTQAEYTVKAPRETFAYTQTVDITSTTALNLSATLDRIVARLNVTSSDNRTASISNVRMTFSAGGKRFSPATGLATVNTGFSNTVGISAAVGAKSTSVSYLFLDSDEQTMDVTIETLDSDGNTVFSTVVEDVPFRRNRITKLTGAMYEGGSTGSIKVNTEWLDDYNGTF